MMIIYVSLTKWDTDLNTLNRVEWNIRNYVKPLSFSDSKSFRHTPVKTDHPYPSALDIPSDPQYADKVSMI